MLPFLRDPVRHRVVFTALLKYGRYEVEMLGTRWYTRVYHQGHLYAIGDGDGFDTFDCAAHAAETDAMVRLRDC